MAGKSEDFDESMNSVEGEFNAEDDEQSQGATKEAENNSKKARTQTPSPSHSGPFPSFIAASPPKFISFEQLMKATNGVRNMSLAHEIAVDSNFSVEKIKPEENSIEKKVKEVMHRAFWDAMQEKLADDPPDYSHVLILIEEVKENLLGLLMPQHVRLRAQINEVLDIDLIRQKVEHETFDMYYYSDYVIKIMARLCSPARDEQISKIREKKDIVPLFKEIFEVLDLMKMDMANFTIQQIRPYLQQQSVDYERKKFQEFLKAQEDAGMDGLELTKFWLKRSFDKCEQDVEYSSTASALCAKTPAAILNQAYMELLEWNDRNLFPETLVMDQGRFLEIRDKSSKLTLIASILLVTYNTVGSSVVGIRELKENLKSHIMVLLENVIESNLKSVILNVAEQVIKEVNSCLQKHGFSELDEAKAATLAGQVKDVVSKDHAVSILMRKRVLNFILESLSSKHTEPMKVPPGFSSVETELGQLCGQFLRLVSHNRSIFGPYYADIINVLLHRKHEDLSPRG